MSLNRRGNRNTRRRKEFWRQGDADELSDDNKCAIHNSFDSNRNWPYDWEEYCSD